MVTAGAAQHRIIQAEDAVLKQGKVETEHAGYTGSGYFNFDNASGTAIEWQITAKQTAVESLFVVYAFSGTSDRPLALRVNDSLVVPSLNFIQTGAFTVWGTQSALVPLHAGMNTLRLTSLTSTGGPNIDRIEVTGEEGTMQYELKSSVAGKGTIVRSPNASFYDAGTMVVLTAVPAGGSVFQGWGGDLSGTKNPDTVTMTGAKNVTASFRSIVASVYHLSPFGNDSTGDGSSAKPFYTVTHAAALVVPGDSIVMHGGVYHYTDRINLSAVGTAQDRITLTAPKGERAVLDFSAMTDDDANQGIRLTGSYWHFYGLDIAGAGDNGLLVERDKPSGATYDDIKDKTDQAHDNIIEFCRFYRNRDSGVQLKNLAAYNSFINCDSYENRDATDGDADGFAPKLTVGTGNYFYGCRAWQNSDDGWDHYLKAKEDGFPQDMVTTIENCWAFQNGYLSDGTPSTGNGNGFKLGGSSGKDQRHDLVLRRCLSFDNLQKGFDQNGNAGNMTLLNCTGFSRALLTNSSHFTYNIDGATLADGKKLVHTNNLSIGDGLVRKDSKWAECKMVNGVQTTCDYLAKESDFISIDTTGMRGPRGADGSLPKTSFMRLAPGNTKHINTGTVIDGITFSGSAPDLGAFEVTAPSAAEQQQNVPNGFSLQQNYPNPFNPSTTITYSVEQAGLVTVTVYDIIGRAVAVLQNGPKEAGVYTLRFDGSAFSSGMYLYRLQQGTRMISRSMLLLK